MSAAFPPAHVDLPCRKDPEAFHAPGGEQSIARRSREDRALAFCGRCAFVDACLKDALDTEDIQGIRGAKTPGELMTLLNPDTEVNNVLTAAQQIVWDHYQDGLSRRDISDETGLTIEQVYNRIGTIRSKLRARGIDPGTAPGRDASTWPDCGKTRSAYNRHTDKSISRCQACLDYDQAYRDAKATRKQDGEVAA